MVDQHPKGGWLVLECFQNIKWAIGVRYPSFCYAKSWELNTPFCCFWWLLFSQCWDYSIAKYVNICKHVSLFGSKLIVVNFWWGEDMPHIFTNVRTYSFLKPQHQPPRTRYLFILFICTITQFFVCTFGAPFFIHKQLYWCIGTLSITVLCTFLMCSNTLQSALFLSSSLSMYIQLINCFLLDVSLRLLTYKPGSWTYHIYLYTLT